MPAIQKRSFILTSYKMEYFEQSYWDQFGGYFDYVLVGKEVCPTTGRDHLHIYLECKTKRSLGGLKRILHDSEIHIEFRMGTRQEAMEYCKKDGNWWEMGEQHQQGRRNDLLDIRDMIRNGAGMLDVAEEHFGDFVRYFKGFSLYADLLKRREQRMAEKIKPKVIVYIGPAGSGKSWHCAADKDYQEDGYQLLIQQSGKVFFDGYEGQKTIWFDEFSGSTLPFSTFCRIADRYGCRVETKGGSVEIVGLKKILISTIELPSQWWRGSERFLRDPKQLYRRIDELFFIPAADDGVFYKPILINKRNGSYGFVDDEYLSEISKLKEPVDDSAAESDMEPENYYCLLNKHKTNHQP